MLRAELEKKRFLIYPNHRPRAGCKQRAIIEQIRIKLDSYFVNMLGLRNVSEDLRYKMDKVSTLDRVAPVTQAYSITDVLCFG